jgi:hypothetical protein
MESIKRFINKDPQSGVYILMLYIAYNVTVIRINAMESGNLFYDTLDASMLVGITALMLINVVRMIAQTLRARRELKESKALTKELKDLTGQLEVLRSGQ